jgi:hypothetical protein
LIPLPCARECPQACASRLVGGGRLGLTFLRGYDELGLMPHLTVAEERRRLARKNAVAVRWPRHQSAGSEVDVGV